MPGFTQNAELQLAQAGELGKQIKMLCFTGRCEAKTSPSEIISSNVSGVFIRRWP